MATSSAFVPWMIPNSPLDTGGTPSIRGVTNREMMNHDDSNNMILLRPIVQQEKQSIVASLPSLQDVMFFSEEDDDPASSPGNTSSRSQSLSSWSPIDDCSSGSDTSRKNSIASLLNSSTALVSPTCSPPLTSSSSSSSSQSSSSMKRGRPRQNPQTKHPNKRLKRPVTTVTAEEEKSNNNNAVTKGLRHFSKLVSDKVAEHGVTTYNQVADELAAEIRDGRKQGYDQKNIRRRVYDALNVLMAMDIIAKDKKEIRWLGIPSTLLQPDDEKRKRLMQEIQHEQQRQHDLMQAKQQMRSIVCDKMEQYLQIKQLVHRNQQQQQQNSTIDKVSLPFFVVGCNDPSYKVEMAADGRQAMIIQERNNMPIYEDARVLQLLGFHHMSRQDKLAFLPDPNWSQYLFNHDSIAAS